MQQHWFPRHRVLLLSFLLITGCAEKVSQAQSPSSPPRQSQHWLEQGRELSRLGQSVRAEQYLLAAWDAGASVDEVAPLLIEVCVKDGRLRSALFYVARVRRMQPSNTAVLQLSATLHSALGQSERAEQDVAALESLEPTQPEALFFLGEYLLLHGQCERGRKYLSEYLQRAPQGEDAPWARSLLSRDVAHDPTPDAPDAIEPQQVQEGGAS